MAAASIRRPSTIEARRSTFGAQGGRAARRSTMYDPRMSVVDNLASFRRGENLENISMASRGFPEHTIVILGGSYAAIQIAHRLLKYTRGDVLDLRVIMISKNSHFFWNLASVRGIVPGTVPDEDLFGSIESGFSHYATDSFLHIVGSVEQVDPVAKTVAVYHEMQTFDEFDGTGSASINGGEQVIKYDQIILCTGTRGIDPEMPWKNLDSTEKTREIFHTVQRKVGQASHIVVGGGGATGVEVASEIAHQFSRSSRRAKKQVVLVNKGPSVLGGHKIAPKTEKELGQLGVRIIKNATVEGKETKGPRTVLHLGNGEKIETDLYLSCVGFVPNSEYLPEKFKNNLGYVKVDDCFRVPDAAGMWACGDVVSRPRAAFVHTEKQAAGVAANVESLLRGKTLSKVKGLSVDPLVVSLGRRSGVGAVGPMALPGCAVYWIKGRNLGTTRMDGYLRGTQW